MAQRGKEDRHERQQAACYEVEQRLLEARRQLAEKQVEAERTRGRLESQVKESGTIELRIAHNENESQELGLRLVGGLGGGQVIRLEGPMAPKLQELYRGGKPLVTFGVGGGPRNRSCVFTPVAPEAAHLLRLMNPSNS